MADVDGGYRALAYYEADANECPEMAPAPPVVVITVPIPAPLEDADKLDIYFDIAAATGPDYVVTPAGDWLPVSGNEALRQSLLRDYMGNPGEWQTNPEWGAGGRAFIKAKSTKASRDVFAQRLRARTLADPRIESVQDVTVEQFADGGHKFRVVAVKKGRRKSDAPVVITFGSE